MPSSKMKISISKTNKLNCHWTSGLKTLLLTRQQPELTKLAWTIGKYRKWAMEGWITNFAKFKLPKEQIQLQQVQCNSNAMAPSWVNAYFHVHRNLHSLTCFYLQVRNDHWEFYKIKQKNKSNRSFWQIKPEKIYWWN